MRLIRFFSLVPLLVGQSPDTTCTSNALCPPGTECVSTKGPMVPDAPGSCRPSCTTTRDVWGNCVPANCAVWSDGCNVCDVSGHGKQLSCGNRTCYDVKHDASCDVYANKGFVKCADTGAASPLINAVCCPGGKNCDGGLPRQCSVECSSLVSVLFKDCGPGLEKQLALTGNKEWSAFLGRCAEHSATDLADGDAIPRDCAIWFDGCNRCQVRNGQVDMCTMRQCLRKDHARCERREAGTFINEHHERGRQCFDGKDNDNDGKSDCDDPDCQFYGRCRRRHGKTTERRCFDGQDNDHDGKTDCQDEDCRRDPRARRYCRNERLVLPEPGKN